MYVDYCDKIKTKQKLITLFHLKVIYKSNILCKAVIKVINSYLHECTW